jgi:hypothetical protein
VSTCMLFSLKKGASYLLEMYSFSNCGFSHCILKKKRVIS